ncbi:MAG: TetR/AcrR family transcriptional regulator [Acidimicrobiia bacterium]
MPPTSSVPVAGVVEETVVPAKRGRKRRHDSQVERRMILDAAMVVMRRNGFAEAKITDILQEAELSNRAFYRHFSSKDELLLGMCGRDIGFVVRQLRSRIHDAPDPVSGLHAFMDEYLRTFFEPRDPDRIAVFNSEGARRAEGYDAEVRRLDRQVIEPLLEVLRTGADLGVFRTATPERDGYAVYQLVRSLTMMPPEVRPSREDAVAYLMRFCGPALGLAPTSS